MKLCFLVGSLAALAIACAAQTANDVVHALPDVGQCIESAFSTAMGVPDIQGLIDHCGATIADIEKVIADIEASPDGGASASPDKAKAIAAWKAALVDYKAKHPNVK